MESIKNILAITGKPGLYKLVSRGNNMLIVESLVDGKRMPTYARDKIVALSDVSMFTDGDDVTLSEVLTSAGTSYVDHQYTRAYVRHLIHAQEMLGLEILSIHNLAFYLWLVGEARQHILAGDFKPWKDDMMKRITTRL